MLSIGDKVVEITNINSLTTREIQESSGIITSINNTHASVNINGNVKEILITELIKLSLIFNK
jgi:hypothetical protein